MKYLIVGMLLCLSAQAYSNTDTQANTKQETADELALAKLIKDHANISTENNSAGSEKNNIQPQQTGAAENTKSSDNTQINAPFNGEFFTSQKIKPETYKDKQGFTMVPDEIKGQRVYNVGNVATPEFIAFLEEITNQLEQKSKIQLAVVIVPDLLESEPIDQYAMRVAEKLKPGFKKTDNGLVIVLSVNSRDIRIEVGYGLEGVITDLRAKQIITNEFVPYFAKKQYDIGFINAYNSINRLAQANPIDLKIWDSAAKNADKDYSPHKQGLSDFIVGVFLATTIIGFILFKTIGFLGAGLTGLGAGVWGFIYSGDYGMLGIIAFVVAFLVGTISAIISEFTIQIGLTVATSGKGGFGGGGFGGGGASGRW